MLEVGQRVTYCRDTRKAWTGTIIKVFDEPPNAERLYKVAFDDGSEGVDSELVLEAIDAPVAAEPYRFVE